MLLQTRLQQLEAAKMPSPKLQLRVRDKQHQLRGCKRCSQAVVEMFSEIKLSEAARGKLHKPVCFGSRLISSSRNRSQVMARLQGCFSPSAGYNLLTSISLSDMPWMLCFPFLPGKLLKFTTDFHNTSLPASA